MKQLRSRFGTTRLRTTMLCGLVGGPLVAVACSGSAGDPQPEARQPVPVSHELDIEYTGSYDGEQFTLTPTAATADGYAVSSEDDVAQLSQAILGTPDSASFGSGVSATGSNFVALEQISGSLTTRTNGVLTGPAWNATTCGPSVATGLCVQIRMRNMFTNSMIQRAHFELTQLTPTAPTTSVSGRSPQATNQTAPGDTFYGVVGPSYALWRYGALERSTPAGTGPIMYWAFTGTTPSGQKFQFTFKGHVRAEVVDPPVRADATAAASDVTPTYGGATVANAAPTSADIDSTGRYVVFASAATNLVAGATSAISRIYRKDLTTNAIDLISTGPNLATPQTCASTRPSISDDGTVVSFESDCKLVATDTNAFSDVYVRRITDGATILASRTLTGAAADGASSDSDVSPDGKFVAFSSLATTLVTSRPAGRVTRDLYRRDVSGPAVSNNAIIPLTAISASVWLNGDSRNPEIIVTSGNTITTFESDATNGSATADTNGATDVFAFMHTTSYYPASRVQVSLSSAGAALNAASTNPAITADGSFIVYQTAATNVISPATSGSHVYGVSRAQPATVTLLDRTPAGAVANGNATAPDISGSGRFVSFVSTGTNLTVTAASGSQVYFTDRNATQTGFKRVFLVSTSSTFVNQGGTLTGVPALASGGSFLAYISNATNVLGSTGARVFRTPTIDRFNQ